MQWSLNMVHSHFPLCLRVGYHTKWLSHHPWYNLWIIAKAPHHFMVMALGSCRKWPPLLLPMYAENTTLAQAAT